MFRIALLMDLNREYERKLMRGVLQYSSVNRSLQLFKKRDGFLMGPKELTIDVLKEWCPDGIFLREGYADFDVKELGVPVVYAPFTKPSPVFSNVLSDDEGVGEHAAEYLISRGFEHFAFYGIGEECYFSQARKLGFQRAVEASGCTVSVMDRSGGVEVAGWLSSIPRPFGLMVCTDGCAGECYDAVRQAGLHVPEDLAVIGCGNDKLVCDFLMPPLSSVAMNTERAGYASAELLVDMIKGDAVNSTVTGTVAGVVERQSTNILAIEDDVVSAAIRYINSNVDMNIRVEDVVDVVRVSRRSLYDRFARATGMSVYGAIRKARMDYAARLLVETSMPIAEISEKLGFADAKNLARVFRCEKGVAPFRYRMQNSVFG